MKENQLLVNVLPSPTYNWLRMNDADVKVPANVVEGNPMVTRTPDVIATVTDYTEIQDIAGGMGYAFDTFVKNSDADVLKLQMKKNQKAAQPVHIEFDYAKGCAEVNAVYIDAEEGSDLTVVMDFRSAGDAEGFAAVQTKIHAAKNARVLLVQIQRLGQGFRFLNDVAAKTEECAGFEQIELILGGADTYQGSRTDLAGAHSTLKTDIGYLLKNQEHLDMNYIANHIGKKTECAIDVKGVLRDESHKLFRGTIDLRRGAKGALGNELEDVLLMDDDVINQTIPVILCDEEDVEGNHGATIGRIDESLLFYLESRGMSQAEVYEMMAGARIDSVIHKIPDAETRDRVAVELTGHKEERYND